MRGARGAGAFVRVRFDGEGQPLGQLLSVGHIVEELAACALLHRTT
jgi:hypothetical protein